MSASHTASRNGQHLSSIQSPYRGGTDKLPKCRKWLSKPISLTSFILYTNYVVVSVPDHVFRTNYLFTLLLQYLLQRHFWHWFQCLWIISPELHPPRRTRMVFCRILLNRSSPPLRYRRLNASSALSDDPDLSRHKQRTKHIVYVWVLQIIGNAATNLQQNQYLRDEEKLAICHHAVDPGHVQKFSLTPLMNAIYCLSVFHGTFSSHNLSFISNAIRRPLFFQWKCSQERNSMYRRYFQSDQKNCTGEEWVFQNRWSRQDDDQCR